MLVLQVLKLKNNDISKLYDFPKFKTLVDVEGGTEEILFSILPRYPFFI